MKCSLCGVDAADDSGRCILCEKAFAAGEALERERCAVLAEGNGNITGVIVGMSELAAQIRARIIKDSTS